MTLQCMETLIKTNEKAGQAPTKSSKRPVCGISCVKYLMNSFSRKARGVNTALVDSCWVACRRQMRGAVSALKFWDL